MSSLPMVYGHEIEAQRGYVICPKLLLVLSDRTPDTIDSAGCLKDTGRSEPAKGQS